MVISMYCSERPDVESGIAESSHIVQFYEDDGFLSEKVASFVMNGLAANESLVVIATEPHRRVLGDRLRSSNDVSTPASMVTDVARCRGGTLRSFRRDAR
jgi:hypothetical protein